MTGLLQFLPFWMPSVPSKEIQKVQNNAASLILKAAKTDNMTPHFALCTGFQSMLGSNTKFVLFVLALSLLLVLSTVPIYSRFTHPLGHSNLVQTTVYCAFHLSPLCHTVKTGSLTPLEHCGSYFQKTSDFLSQLLPFDEPSRPTFFQYDCLVPVCLVRRFLDSN